MKISNLAAFASLVLIGPIACASAANTASTAGGSAPPEPGPEAPPSAPAPAPSAPASASLPAEITACTQDTDCIAVDKGGCCPDGSSVAINSQQIDTYKQVNKCQVLRMMCSQLRVKEVRVPQCNFATHSCQLVEPNQAFCGGFVAQPHTCPTGYSCQRAKNPDIAGHCTKIP